MYNDIFLPFNNFAYFQCLNKYHRIIYNNNNDNGNDNDNNNNNNNILDKIKVFRQAKSCFLDNIFIEYLKIGLYLSVFSLPVKC